MKNRRILYLMIIILLITFSSASYSLAHYMNKNDLKFEATSKLPYLKLTAASISVDKSSTSVTTNMSLLKGQMKFIFVIKYKDKEVRNMVLEKNFNSTTVLNSKTKAEINEFFKKQGYTVSNMSKGQVTLINISDRYSYNANRYYLGVYNDLVTIYKTDNNGDITAHKLFNANVYAPDGKQMDYDFEAEDKGELQYINIDDLKEKDGVLDDLIFGKKYVKDTVGPTDMEESEYEKGEFKTAEKAFDYARGLLRS